MARQQAGLALDVNLPALLGRQPAHLLHVGAKADQGAQLVFAHHPQDVVLDFLLLGVGPCPLGIGLERKRVQVRRHITGASGVNVVTPGAADFRAALQHDQRRHAVLAQPDRCTQAAKACAHNGYVNLLHGRTVAQLARRRVSVVTTPPAKLG